MRGLILLLCAAAWAQPVPPPPAIIKGNPPGGIGGSCSASALTGYLDTSGRVITCVGSLWTVTGSSSSPAGPAGGGLAGTYPNPTIGVPIVVAGQAAFGGSATVNPLSNLLYPGIYVLDIASSQNIYAAGTDPSGYVEGFGTYLRLNPTVNMSNTAFLGGDFQVEVASGNNKNYDSLYGGWFGARHLGSGSIPFSVGGFFIPTNNAGGTITLQPGAYATSRNTSNGTVTTAAGFYAAANTNSGGGTLTNNYGMYLEAQTAGATNYNLYSVGATAKNHFEGQVLAGFLSGAGSAPSLNVSSCSGASIGAGSTNTAGVITGLPTGACTIVITFASATAAHDWSCQVTNRTTPANLFMQSNTSASTTTATITGVSTSGDSLRYLCAAF